MSLEDFGTQLGDIPAPATKPPSYLEQLRERLLDLKPELLARQLRVSGLTVYTDLTSLHTASMVVFVRCGHYGRGKVRRFTKTTLEHIEGAIRGIIADETARKVAHAERRERWAQEDARERAALAPIEQAAADINRRSTASSWGRLVQQVSVEEHTIPSTHTKVYLFDLRLAGLSAKQADAVLRIVDQARPWEDVK